MYLIYTVLYGVLLVLALPYLAFRSAREPGYGRSVLERLGFAAPPLRDGPSVWIHAVSVGEVLAAVTLLPELSRAFAGRRIVCSVTTTTGRALADDKLMRAGADAVFYCPFDLSFLVRRTMKRLEPELLVVVETEIWPALFREARRAGAKTAIVNARLSDRSFPRYERLRRFIAHTVKGVDSILAQDERYAERFIRLGAPPERVRITGSLKFDAPASTAVSDVTFPSGVSVVVGGSTLEPEESILLRALRSLKEEAPDRGLLLVLAPRHPRRFDEVCTLVKDEGFLAARRSRREPVTAETDVFVLDTLGELDSLYELADVVFVGGSLATWGGHNIIEPAARGKPVLFGPHMQNFRDIARIFVEAEAVVPVENEAALTDALRALLDDGPRREELGRRAREVVRGHRGASARAASALRELVR